MTNQAAEGLGSERYPQMPPTRNAIGIFVGKFPRIDQTHVLREINEMERQGQPVILVPLVRTRETVVHEEARPWLRQAFYVPFFSVRVAWTNLATLFRQPIHYLRLLVRLMAGTVLDPSIFLRTLALFPKSVYLARRLPRMGIKHVHAHFARHPATMAYIVSELSEITFSFTVHGPDVFVKRWLLREKIAAATFVRAVSLFNKAFISGLYPRLSRYKIEVAHVGLNPAEFEKATAEQPRPPRPLQLLSVGALTPSRGFAFLIEAVALMKQAGLSVQLTIVGDGLLRAATQELIEKLNLTDSVRILDAQPQHEVARLMGSTDIFVLPSIIAMDGQMDCMPVSIMEAMAAGKPVVAAAISGISELVRDGITGLLVDAAHSVRIAESVQRLADDPQLRETMGRAGQETIRAEFDIQKTAAALIDLFDRRASRAATARAAAPIIWNIDWPPLHRAAIGLRQFHERSDSNVAELLMADGITKREIIVKQQRSHSEESRPAAERARSEFEILSMLRKLMNEGAGDPLGELYSVPRVLAFDPGCATIVMERARGRSLEAVIRKFRFRGLSGLSTPVRKAATWLRLMHDKTRSEEDGRHILTAVILLALRDLDLVAAGDAAVRRRRSEIRHVLRSHEAVQANKRVFAVGHHGDYLPGNIFVGDSGVDVIDFEGFREGLPMEDVAQFLVHLELYLAYPLLSRHFEKVSNIFIESYASGGESVDRDSLRLFTLTNALHFLARSDRLSGGWLRDHWRRITLRNIITRNIG